VRHRYGNVFLFWIHPLQPTVQQPAGNLCEGLQMNDDGDNDFFFDLLKTIIALLLFLIFVTVIGSIVWGLI